MDGIIQGIRDGVIDCIATDHAPHTLTEKDVEFQLAPFGIIGLETSLALTLTHLVRPGHISLERAIALLSYNGAQICNLAAGTLQEGAPADITIFDPDASWTVKADEFASKAQKLPLYWANLVWPCEIHPLRRTMRLPGISITSSLLPNELCLLGNSFVFRIASLQT